MELWIVGKAPPCDGETPWEIAGVYGSRGQALAACLDGCYFILPTRLNAPLPMGTCEAPGLERAPLPCPESVQP